MPKLVVAKPLAKPETTNYFIQNNPNPPNAQIIGDVGAVEKVPVL